jgi:hypothetical protein
VSAKTIQSVPGTTLAGAAGSALFIPLRGEYFDAFARGEKRTEYRRRGPRWNAETCAIGRRVVLSRGYGKGQRLTGVITGFCYDTIPSRLPGWLECYGHGAGDAACITITLDQPNARALPPGGAKEGQQ